MLLDSNYRVIVNADICSRHLKEKHNFKGEKTTTADGQITYYYIGTVGVNGASLEKGFALCRTCWNCYTSNVEFRDHGTSCQSRPRGDEEKRRLLVTALRHNHESPQSSSAAAVGEDDLMPELQTLKNENEKLKSETARLNDALRMNVALIEKRFAEDTNLKAKDTVQTNDGKPSANPRKITNESKKLRQYNKKLIEENKALKHDKEKLNEGMMKLIEENVNLRTEIVGTTLVKEENERLKEENEGLQAETQRIWILEEEIRLLKAQLGTDESSSLIGANGMEVDRNDY
jgi:hypothetical protein